MLNSVKRFEIIFDIFLYLQKFCQGAESGW